MAANDRDLLLIGTLFVLTAGALSLSPAPCSGAFLCAAFPKKRYIFAGATLEGRIDGAASGRKRPETDEAIADE